MLPEMMFGLDESFRYARCADCASLFIQEIPLDLVDYYSTKYYSFNLDPEAVIGRRGVAQAVGLVGRSVLLGHNVIGRGVRRAIGVRQVQTTMALFESVRLAGLPRGRESRVLDVGSGSGALVYALSLVGLREVTGIDPFNETDRTFDTGAQVRARDLSEVQGSYDLVMLHHCFEHVPDPRETLNQVRRVLAPGGRVLVRMPTVSSEAFERYGTSWMQLDPPRHLTVFSRLGMERLCARVGLLIKELSDDSTAFQFWASEQARSGVSLVSDTSHFVHPDRSAFSADQIRAWEKEAASLNARGRGDQAAWVLTSA